MLIGIIVGIGIIVDIVGLSLLVLGIFSSGIDDGMNGGIDDVDDVVDLMFSTVLSSERIQSQAMKKRIQKAREQITSAKISQRCRAKSPAKSNLTDSIKAANMFYCVTYGKYQKKDSFYYNLFTCSAAVLPLFTSSTAVFHFSVSLLVRFAMTCLHMEICILLII